jgi:CubicO group peptidase (beta-lactamase class C family)
MRLVLCLAAALAVGTSALASPIDERIARVERSLLPPVLTDATQPMRLAERMTHYGVPGLSVAVVDQGRLAWAQSWGVAQRGDPTPLTPQTLMQAASISKALTALGAFRLADQGRLDLDADVNTKLLRWKLPPGAQTVERPVTVRRVLGHSAGLTVPGFPGYAPGAPVPTLVQVLDGQPPANTPPVRADTLPGSVWRYSGGGTTLLQLLMEDVTGEPFAAWMKREVLVPAGMPASFFGALPDAPLALAAAGHRQGRVIDGLRTTHPEQSAAALWTTPSELARLSIGLQRVLAGDSVPWLARTRLVEALQPSLPGAPSGLGFTLDGGDFFGHDGSNAGFEARWRADRQGRAVIVMANANGAMRLIDEVLRAVASAHGWSDRLPARLSVAQLRETFSASPLFLRGSMNGWGLDAPLAAAATAPERFVVDVELPAGRSDFKFAAPDWQRVDLGASSDGRADALELRGGNLRIELERAGRYRFTLDVSDPAAPRYTVEPLPR